MAILTDYFVGSSDDLERVDIRLGPALPTAAPSQLRGLLRRRADTSAAESFETARFTSVDPVKTAMLEVQLTGASYEDLLRAGAMRTVRDGGQDGPWIVRVRPELVSALTRLHPQDVRPVADEWARTDEWQADHATADDLVQVVEQLIRLAQLAQGSGKDMFCWMSL